MNPAPQFIPQQLIAQLERRALDSATAPGNPIWGAKIEGVPFLRIRGQARFWEDPHTQSTGYEQHMEDLVTGFHGQAHAFAYLLLGNRAGVHVYAGMQGAGADTLLSPALKGMFPGIQLALPPETHLGTAYQASGVFKHLGRLTGIPTRKSGAQASLHGNASQQAQGRAAQEGQVEQIERLIRALIGEDWGYLVWATPASIGDTVRLSQERLNQLTGVSATIHGTENYQATKTESIGPTASITEARSQTVDRTDRWAQFAVELLESDLARLQLGKAQGMWQTEVYFFAARPETLSRVHSLLRAIFAGEGSTPEPVRTFVGSNTASQPAEAFKTLLTSGEVSTLCQLPRQEFPGYQVCDFARFDVDLPAAPSADAIPVGQVLDGNNPTGGWFSVERADFAKHGLVVGVTGSGKTNTIFHLLDKLWNQGKGIPFLVIEPAKTEYRDLLNRPAFQKVMRIYTLGDERVAPYRLNPFEFEIGSGENRVHVQTHIDYLKSVFNAAFVLYAPMPYVLETCLHEIYQDKGWDLTTSQNRRLPVNQRGHEAQWPVFPTLTELYNKIDEVVDRLGYEERIERDVKAGLKARIGSLRLGGKGLMLDTRSGVPLADLLARPTVLELERVGNDDEKAFLIGLILTRLYEYRSVQARSASNLPPVQHVTVFEEAHRLLKNVPIEVGSEEANTKGQAVETFANMLSEIRAYGQGVLIAEQIPTKLAPDAIKNTNLKIMHRVVAADDRDIMSGAMNLSPEQNRVITSLGPGQAAAFAEGADNPYLIQVVRQPEKNLAGRKRVTDAEVHTAMQAVTGGEMYDAVPGYSRHLALPPERLTQVRDMALDVMTHPEFHEHFACYFLSLVLEPEQAVLGYNQLLQFIRRVCGKLSAEVERQTATALLLHTLDQMFDRRGRHYRWLYNVTGTLRQQATEALVKVAGGYENRQEVIATLSTQTARDLAQFVAGYAKQMETNGPFAGCMYCPRRCFYRWEVATLLPDRALARDFTQAIRGTRNDQQMWALLAASTRTAAARLLTTHNTAHIQEVAVCYASQMSARLDFSNVSQKKLVKNIQQVLANPPAKTKK